MTYFYTFIPSGLSYHFSPNLKSFISIFGFVQLVKKITFKKKKATRKERNMHQGHDPAFNPVRH